MFSARPSIRSIMISGIVFSAPKSVIHDQITALFPEKMGNVKFDNHYKWYVGRIRNLATAECRDAILLHEEVEAEMYEAAHVEEWEAARSA